MTLLMVVNSYNCQSDCMTLIFFFFLTSVEEKEIFLKKKNKNRYKLREKCGNDLLKLNQFSFYYIYLCYFV